MLFLDRREGGRRLAARLIAYADRDDVIALALPRGGVPVAHEVAQALRCPLDVFVVRKIGMPGHEELALGAIASGGTQVLNSDLMRRLGVSEADLAPTIAAEEHELRRRESYYHAQRTFPGVTGKTVLLIDDGLATGATMTAAALAVKEKHPRRVVIAVPVASLEACAQLASLVDAIICVDTPEPFWGVGHWYRQFGQTSDEEVRRLLADQPEYEDVSRENWLAFLSAFTDQHRGWLVRTNGDFHPLDSVRFDANGEPMIRIITRDANGESTVHDILRPTRVRVYRRGRYDAGLEVVAADGQTLKLTFRSALPPEMLDGFVEVD